ncbi:MAG: hypothetical protein R8K50_05200 [Mariprofundus sp.]
MKAVLKSYVPRSTITINRVRGRSPITIPTSLVLFIVVVCSASLIYAGTQWAAPDSKANNITDDRAHRQTIAQQQAQLARKEAELALRGSQITALKQQIHQGEQDRHLMQQRLSMFDDVLAARTVSGVHVLNPEAHWRQADGQIDYHLVLVKGNNYPRWALGHLQFRARLADGRMIALSDSRGKADIKYEMTTHLFMEGTLLWHETTAPSSLHVTLINHLGKKTGQADFPVLSFTGIPDQTTTEESKP